MTQNNIADNIKLFKWTGINIQGKRTDGTIQASDMKDAQIELKKIGVEVISLEPKTQLKFFSPRLKKIKKKDILLFTRFLSTMLSSGLPILQALDIIANDQENPSMKTLVLSIKNDVSGGKTLADSFSQHPKYFNDLYCNLIKAGEKSGVLDKILNRLANYLEKTETLKRKIKKALVYPIAILSVAFLVSGILLVFVVPQFQDMFQSFGAKLPFFTRMIVQLSHFLRGFWWLIGLILFILFLGIYYNLRNSEAARHLRDKWILKLYIIGPVLRKGMIARFTRTLSTTLEAGMPIVDSMRSMAQIMGNSIYVNGVMQICDELISGHQLSTAMSSTQLFPNMTIQMISVGEASGKLSDMLNKIADYYEEEVNHTVDTLSTLLEPLIMLILGVIVGTFVIAMYLPIFKLGSLF